jgi:hypothetical protein
MCRSGSRVHVRSPAARRPRRRRNPRQTRIVPTPRTAWADDRTGGPMAQVQRLSALPARISATAAHTLWKSASRPEGNVLPLTTSPRGAMILLGVSLIETG